MTFKENDRVELKRDEKGHGAELKKGRQGKIFAVQKSRCFVVFDNDGGAKRVIDPDNLRKI